MPTPDPTLPRPERLHDLDCLRVCAFGVLVLYHVGMYYVTWDWHVNSPRPVPALEPLMMLSAPWRLSLLFLVSGMATAFLLARAQRQAAVDGRVRFLGSRSWRLLPPLLFGMAVVVVPQAYYAVVEQLPGGYDEGYLAFWARYLRGDGSFCDADGCLVLPTWNHLWFVAYLWVYTVALWCLWRFARPLLDRAATLPDRLLSGCGLLLWPAAALAATRLLLVGRFGSTHALTDDWYNHVQYFGVFLLGFLAAHSPGFRDAALRLRWPALVLWLASWAVLAWYFSHYAGTTPPDALRILMRVVWGLDQWWAIVAVLGFARRLAPGDGPLLRYLVPAVFPVYILHQTVIVVAAHHFKPLGLHPALEGPLLVAITFGACFAGYETIRRVPLLRPLFGLKGRDRRPAAPASAGATTVR